MSRYVLLVLINLPLLFIGVISAITHYKTGRISKKRCTAEVLLWVCVGIGLVAIEPIYNTLLRHNLTNSTPMSLLDIVLLTLLLLCFFLIKETNDKISHLSRKFSRMHESLAIAEAERENAAKNK